MNLNSIKSNSFKNHCLLRVTMHNFIFRSDQNHSFQIFFSEIECNSDVLTRNLDLFPFKSDSDFSLT